MRTTLYRNASRYVPSMHVCYCEMSFSTSPSRKWKIRAVVFHLHGFRAFTVDDICLWVRAHHHKQIFGTDLTNIFRYHTGEQGKAEVLVFFSTDVGAPSSSMYVSCVLLVMATARMSFCRLTYTCVFLAQMSSGFFQACHQQCEFC